MGALRTIGLKWSAPKIRIYITPERTPQSRLLTSQTSESNTCVQQVADDCGWQAITRKYGRYRGREASKYRHRAEDQVRKSYPGIAGKPVRVGRARQAIHGANCS